MSISTLDIAWMAGLLEGEGCFGHSHGSISISLLMTDKDVVEKAGRMVGATTAVRIRSHLPNRKDAYRWTLCGKSTAGWCMTVLPLMGARRAAKIKSLLADWMKMKRYRAEITDCIHTSRKYFGKGMCRACYASWYHDTNRDAVNAAQMVRYYKNHDFNKARNNRYRAEKKLRDKIK